MIYMKIPCGKSEFIYNIKYTGIKGFYEISDLIFDDNANLFKPVVDKSGNNNILNWNNKTINKTFLNNYDIDYLIENHGLKSFKIVKALISINNIDVQGEKIFGPYINTLFNQKKEQDLLKDKNDSSYNEAYRETIKLFLNSLSGKLVEDTSKYNKVKFLVNEEDIEEYEKMADEYDEYGLIKKSDIKTLNNKVKFCKDLDDIEGRNEKYNKLLPLGIMIYSYSKRLLFEYINLLPNKSNDIIHVETDSIYFKNKFKNDFLNNMNKYNGIYPVNIGDNLGNICQETHNKKAIFIGKKCYYLENEFNGNNNKILMMKCKGISKTTIDKYGTTKNIITTELFEKLAIGKSVTTQTNNLKRVLDGNTRIDNINSHKIVRPNNDFRIDTGNKNEYKYKPLPIFNE